MRASLLPLFVLALAGCATDTLPPATPEPPEVVEVPPPTLPLEACRLPDVPEPVLCATLAVPENRARPDRTIPLRIVVVPALGDRTLPPLFDLAGGPGLAATESAGFWVTMGVMHRENRDIVLVDQRGTGGSNALPCAVGFSNPLNPVLDADTVRRCREALAGTDLSQYSTAAAVEDLEAVRVALGHEQVDLTGLSYGTRLAQEYLRAYPQRVRAMALLGTVSPVERLPLPFARGAEAVLNKLAERCRMDPECARAVPRLERDIAALDARFAQGPVSAKLAGANAVTLERGPFWEAVRAQLTSTASQRRLPWLLHEAARGRFAPLLKAMNPGGPDPHANGLLLSVVCPEDTQHITDADVAASSAGPFGDYRVRQQRAACEAWGLPAAPPRPGFVSSNVPVLLLAGDMDHAAPLAQSRAVAAHLPNARVVVIPESGHLADGLSGIECLDQLIAEFFDAGSAAGLDIKCVAAMQPPAFRGPPKAGGLGA